MVDDGSTDRTAAGRPARAGATVHRLPRSGGQGPGQLAEGAQVASGDLVVFLDADVLDTDPAWIPQLLGPLLADPHVELVKGYYERPLDGRPTGGGRVTELAARPMLSLLFPDLAGILQPLAGETAARRATILDVGIEPDYGAELGLLIDVARRGGAARDRPGRPRTRTHRNRPLDELASMSRDVLRVALERAGVPTRLERRVAQCARSLPRMTITSSRCAARDHVARRRWSAASRGCGHAQAPGHELGRLLLPGVK